MRVPVTFDDRLRMARYLLAGKAVAGILTAVDCEHREDLSRVAIGESFQGHRPDRHRRACTAPNGRSAQDRDRAMVWRAGR